MPLSLLVIDDNVELLAVVRRYFTQRSEFAPPQVFNRVPDALAYLQGHRVDVALVDLHLPDDSGVRGIRRVVELAAADHVIAFTGRTDDEAVRQAVAAGAGGYIEKTESLSRIADMILLAAAGSPAFSAPALKRLLGSFRPQPAPEKLAQLTPAETRVLELTARGEGTKEIASLLNLSVHTVYLYNKRILKKLGVPNRTAAAAYYLEATRPET